MLLQTQAPVVFVCVWTPRDGEQKDMHLLNPFCLQTFGAIEGTESIGFAVGRKGQSVDVSMEFITVDISHLTPTLNV